MRLIDLYFRAFRAFRKYTKNDSESQKDRKVISHANLNEDEFISIKYTCKIDEDWIKNIEEGLIYIEKAIREERQFIRSEGEVVRIEKVKRTSKATVEHLARHSELITHLPEDEDDPIVPDKLYMVEKLSDYAIYENRFLYMLLCYIRDFIQIRIDNIRDKMTTYQSQMTINKEIKMNTRHINYHLNYSDINKNDPYLIDNYQNIPLVTRIETIYAIVLSLLSTPLMKEVSKAPMIKPPIVKTNVLRMNQNFKAALQLYDYITSYNKDGYTIEEVKKIYNPFPDEMSDEIAETIQLTSILSYIMGNEIKADLIEVYENEEKKLKEEENQKIIEEIKRLKKRIEEMDEDPTEYILKLEKRNRKLEKDSSDLAYEKEKNAEYKLQISNLEKEQELLNEKIRAKLQELDQKDLEINALNKKYFDDMTLAEQIHRQEIANVIEKNNQKINSILDSHQKSINELKEKHQNDIVELNKQHLNELKQLQEQNQLEQQQLMMQYDEVINNLKIKILDLNKNIEGLQREKKELEVKYERLEEEKKYAMGRIRALKQQYGLTDEDDYTSKERFTELELEMLAYKKLFKEQWKKTKMKIREEVKQAAKASIGKK